MNNKINKELINNYINKYNLTLTDFCRKCKISSKTLKNMTSGRTNYYLSSLVKLSKLLDVNLSDLFQQNKTETK